MKDYLELSAIERDHIIHEALEKRLKKYFKDLIYQPLLAELDLSSKTLKNAKKDPVIDALFQGKITYSQGTFSGQFNASISKGLKDLGATFDKRNGTFKIPMANLPIEIKNVISASESRFQDRIAKIDQRLSEIVPEQLAAQFKCEDLFDRALYRADQSFQKNVKNIGVQPELTETQRAKIAAEWQNNMNLWIQNFTEEEIKKLRQQVQESTFAGNRYGDLVKTIQDSYGVSADKAKFLARQETNLLLTKFKEARYTDAGVHEYKWLCVHRPHDTDPKQHVPGNVRYSHGLLEGKIFRWDNPPVTTNPGEPLRRNNPGEDYNCRCAARPLLRR